MSWWVLPLKAQVATLLDRESRTLLKPISWSFRKTACGWKCGCPPPEPAVGVFTTAGTRQGRLRRHYVIGSAAP
jgi:hypothetical protein